MTATLLLDEYDNYAYEDRDTPYAPAWDKQMLAASITGKYVSEEGYNMLPPSLQDLVTPTEQIEPTAAITIPEIDALADMLIVTRGTMAGRKGKRFRFKNFQLITRQGKIEIWKRITH